MASSLETNKILAAILTAGIFASGAGVMSRIIYHPTAPEEPSYIIAVVDEGGSGGEEGGGETVSVAALLASADAAGGESGAKKCAACHTFEEGGENKIGPNLYGVLGRDIGAVSGFAYSEALTGLDGAWDYDALDGFLAKPKDYAPGTKMAYAGMRSAEARADLILYLRSLAADPLPLPEAEAVETEAAEETEGGESEGEADVADAEETETEGAAEAEADVDEAEEVAEEAEDTADEVAEAASDVVDGAEETAEAAAEAVTDAAFETTEAAGDAVADAAGAAEDAIEEAADATEAVSDAAGDAVEETADAAEGAVEDVADATGDVADDATEAAAGAAGATVAAVSEAASDAADTAADAGDAAAVGLVAMIADGDVGKGEKVSKKCKACHVFDEGGKNKLGPALWDVVNREIASHDGFKYSGALSELEGEWTYDKLDQYLAGPKKYVPGTKMVFAGVKKEEDRANLIAYLRSLAAEPAPLN